MDAVYPGNLESFPRCFTLSLLPPASYGLMFRKITEDLAEHPFDLHETGKRVRDRMRMAGSPVSLADVIRVLRGLLFRGHVFGAGKSADNLPALCLREQIVIDMAMDAAITRWLVEDARRMAH